MKKIVYCVAEIDPKMAKEALEIQDACNLTAVANSLTRVLEKLWEESNKTTGKGTYWVNQHPIVALYVNKLVHLNAAPPDGLDLEKWHLVSQAAEKLKQGKQA